MRGCALSRPVGNALIRIVDVYFQASISRNLVIIAHKCGEKSLFQLYFVLGHSPRSC